MSGTSADGVDGCLVRVTGWGVPRSFELLAVVSRPFSRRLREAVLGAAGPGGRVEDLPRMAMDLGACYARAVDELLHAAGLTAADVDLVGCHGQTVRHLPRVGRRHGATLQIGEGALVAHETGIPVLSDFRVADVAAGGQGAPLVPVADRLLFSREDGAVALQNLGGMGNVTLLPPAGSAAPPLGFDTGPGNALIDLAAAHASGGRERFDRDGRRARRGRVLEPLVRVVTGHPFLRRRPPKSTGREAFGEEMFERIKRRAGAEGAAPDDVVASMTEATARTVAGAYERFLPASLRPRVVLVAGGGARNAVLMERLAALLAPVPVGVLGGDDPRLGTYREALCWAVLADETLGGRPGSEPAVTGASTPAILGKLSLPPTWMVQR